MDGDLRDCHFADCGLRTSGFEVEAAANHFNSKSRSGSGFVGIPGPAVASWVSQVLGHMKEALVVFDTTAFTQLLGVIKFVNQIRVPHSKIGARVSTTLQVKAWRALRRRSSGLNSLHILEQ